MALVCSSIALDAVNQDFEQVAELLHLFALESSFEIDRLERPSSG
jgi:hypothetical protein